MTAARRKGAECEGVACEHALGQQPLQLYTYLWSKASADSDSIGQRQAFSFVLADTVVFKRQKPVKWLFTSKQERGKILCKTKRFLSTPRVLQEFLVPRWAPNVLPKLDNDKQILATYAYLDRSSAFGEMHIVVEHLDKAGLEHLLEEREKPGLSVLQRFIPTKSGYNHTVRSDYTADSCTVQKCISPFLLSDTKASMVQRTATFEIDDPLLRHRDVTDKDVRRTIERINAEISDHLESIVGKEMVRIVNYFKIGADHRIYLLWSSMLSFDAGVKGAAKHYSLAPGNHSTGPAASLSSEEDHELRPTMNQSLIGCTAQLKVCPNCNRMLPRDQVQYMVTHRSIIRQFERDSVKKDDERAEERIPTLLRAISGPIQVGRFKQLKQSATYLYQTVQLCLTCSRSINVDPKACSSPHRNNNEDATPGQDMAKEEMAIQADQSLPRTDLPSAKEDEARKPQKPVVVVHTRALSAGSMRMSFSKKIIRNGSNQYRQRLLRVLPRLNAFDPPELPPRERVRQLALHLKRAFGHPSLRFALSQCNVFPVGSMVPSQTLAGVCSTDLLMPAARYWTELCQMQESSINPPTIDIDAIDSLLAASLNSSHRTARPAEESFSHPRQRIVRPTRFIQVSEASCPTIPRTSSSTICVPKRPDRPHSCIPVSASSRRARLLSLASCNPPKPPSSSEIRPADPAGGPKSAIQLIDGIQCRVQMSARSSDDGQCMLHLEVAKLSSEGGSNQAMELTLKITEILALLGPTENMPHLASQAALLDGILPLLRIENAQLCIPALQQEQQTEQHGAVETPASRPSSPHLLPRPPPGRASVHFQ
ncbi:hypothetical protein PHYPSEUDO_014611 [Phytophthora pseudosyringae]|uniref:Uncharacterized protein n=1 Tax=Phytophthora pseudosyringae TaxID=221518 RepID=A0A8T1W5V9_9STRA|nr:hypothetical protein PHYPSEUDO_014611 [Phytophthora pseudosyringae]